MYHYKQNAVSYWYFVQRLILHKNAPQKSPCLNIDVTFTYQKSINQ